MRQPRVIAEVIGGILLGPSILGRIPGFSDAIFPEESMPVLSLAANVGLILFLFLVGLEVDLRLLLSNWKIALSVGAAGMAIPFGLGVGIAYGLYHQFKEDDGLEPVSFGIYALFIGVAMAITVRILLLQEGSAIDLYARLSQSFAASFQSSSFCNPKSESSYCPLVLAMMLSAGSSWLFALLW